MEPKYTYTTDWWAVSIVCFISICIILTIYNLFTDTNSSGDSDYCGHLSAEMCNKIPIDYPEVDPRYNGA